MKTLLFTLLIFASTMLSAQNPIEIKLWNGQMPNSNDMTRQIENGPIYISEPTLKVYPAPNSNGMAIVACPGGGYSNLAMGHEGTDMASWFNNQGITYAVLTYRMPNCHHNVPLSDALGIMGSSAGGHLASTLATHYTDKTTRPDFQILFYPVITMDPTYSHLGSHDNLFGENP